MTPASRIPAADEVGASTLERMAGAPAFNRWMYDRISRWIGDTVLEVGSGIGNMSRHFLDREAVVLTDTETAYLDYLEAKYGSRPNVSVYRMELPEVPPELDGREFDSIVCLNVLEHIGDDLGSLRAMRRLLSESGMLVLLVPAFGWLYGSLDDALGHHRRYTPDMLRERYAAAGLRVEHIEYFNAAGMPGWWFTGRVMKRRVIPEGALSLYDSLVPLFRLERFLPFRIGQSLIAIGRRT